MKRHEALNHQQVQIQQEVAMWTKALENVRAETTQRIIINEDVLRH